ncbi:MAG TPA: BrnT family toxin [Pyrinomonadaceae bacterium]|nr:BrnT family toxin [Pyrinomonadaceae bacterium]
MSAFGHTQAVITTNCHAATPRIDIVYTQALYLLLMAVSYTLHQIEFEWDSRKAAANLRKHKISFETSCEVFFDPFLHVVDAGVVEGELRDAIIGLTVNWRLLYVVYVERDDVIRIISARPAEKSERDLYENQ